MCEDIYCIGSSIMPIKHLSRQRHIYYHWVALEVHCGVLLLSCAALQFRGKLDV